MNSSVGACGGAATIPAASAPGGRKRQAGPSWRPAAIRVLAVAAPLVLTALVFQVPGWPKPYSWQYLGVSLAVAILAGIRSGLLALVVATLCVLWLGVPTPVHPGVEMFVAIDLCLLALLHRWRRAQQQLAEALTEADRRKDDFIAILSHELRNPLAPIRFALPLLRAEDLSARGARALDVVDRQVGHLARLVDDLLDVSRITNGKIEICPERVTLGSVVAAATEAASPAILAGRHRLDVEVSDEPIALHADPVRLAQVITNLLINSAKYTPQGGEIALRAGRENGDALIRVRDNGVGIPAQSMTAVFDMFRQVTGSDHRWQHGRQSQGGLGIGLALAKQLVEMHGGSIEARSPGVGRGAEFVVRLPVAEEGEASASATV